MNDYVNAMTNMYILGALIAIAFILLGIMIKVTIKNEKK
jgi:hypothetical protein